MKNLIMNLEEKLYKLVESVDVDNINGFGVHEGSLFDCRFPEEEYSYRVYHSDGYCFEVGFYKAYHTETGEYSHDEYEFDNTAHFDGFKEITIEKAIELIEKEGVSL